MLYWLFFGSSALIGVYTLAGGTKLIQDVMTGLPVGADRHRHPDPDHLDHPRLLHRLDRHPAADCADLRAGRVALGFDPVWMGVLFCMNMQISYISPPFGPAAFYLKGVTPPGITLGDIFRSIWPYLGLQFIALGLVIAFPQIALWLPETMAR